MIVVRLLDWTISWFYENIRPYHWLGGIALAYNGCVGLGMSSWWWRYLYLQEQLPNLDFNALGWTALVSGFASFISVLTHGVKHWGWKP